MDGLLSTLLVSSIPSLLATLGLFWTIYRSRATTARKTRSDYEREQDERIKWRDEELAKLRKENEGLQQQCKAYLQALSMVRNQPEALVKYQILQNGGGAPPEVRH